MGNKASNLVVIDPITSKITKIYSFEVGIIISGKKGKVMVNQCRSIDKSRLGKKLYQLEPEIMSEVDEAIKITFGLT